MTWAVQPPAGSDPEYWSFRIRKWFSDALHGSVSFLSENVLKCLLYTNRESLIFLKANFSK